MTVNIEEVNVKRGF